MTIQKKTIYIPDIECDSCVRLLKKRFDKNNGIESYDINNDSAIFNINEKTSFEQIIHTIKEAGFRASFVPFERKTIAERKRHFKENRSAYKIEMNAIKYAIYSFLILTLIEYIAYLGIFQSIPGFLGKYAWWLFYLNISIATLGAATWQVFAYKAKVTCMVGMMIGMTVGMQAGMMLGAVIGATNGFFIGSMVGMLIGVTVGTITGKCCGVMGIMEGMMAGLMGGTMGPMISIMMYSDHLLWFMPFYIIVNIIILAGLSYMMLEEVVEQRKDVIRRPIDFTFFMAICAMVTFVLVAIMIYGPKTALLS